MQLDAYTVRKIAPRLLFAVIGVNLSIYLCMAAIDITNIFGGGLGDLLRRPFIDANSFDKIPDIDTSVESSIVGLVGVGGVAIGLFGLASGLAALSALEVLAMFAIVIAGVAMVAVAILATLVIRYGAILFLTIVSPVAIALWVLPGTEKYFRTWWDTFLKVLIMYPIIAVIFALSDILGSIFLQTNDSVGDISSVVSVVVTMFVLYAPLFMIPFAFKLSGGIVAQFYDFANSRGVQPLSGRLNKWKEDPNSFYGSRASRMQDSRYQKGGTFKQVSSGITGGISGFRGADRGERLAGFRAGRRAAIGTIADTKTRLRAAKAQEELETIKMVEGNDDVWEAGSRMVADPSMSKQEAMRFLMAKNSDMYGAYDEAGNIVQSEVQERNAEAALSMINRLRSQMGDQVFQKVALEQASKATTFGNVGGPGQMARMAQLGAQTEFGQIVNSVDAKNNLKSINRMDQAGGSTANQMSHMTNYLDPTKAMDEQAFEDAQIDSAYEKLTPQQISSMDHNGTVKFMQRGQQRLKAAIASGDDERVQFELANLKSLHEGITYSSAENKQEIIDMFNQDVTQGMSGDEAARASLYGSFNEKTGQQDTSAQGMMDAMAARNKDERRVYNQSVRVYDATDARELAHKQE